MNREVKLSEAVGRLLSDENKDKSLGEIGDDLSNYLVQIKDLVDSGKVTYNGLTQEISKYLNGNEVPKPGSVSQLLLGCVEGEDWCPVTEKEEDVSFFYDPDSKKFIPISSIPSLISVRNYAIIYISGDPREIDIDSLQELEVKGFQKMKIRYRGIADSVYTEINISNLEKHIAGLSKRNISNESVDTKINTFMSISFLVIILVIIFYMKNHHVPSK
jgi:hypothetical protein